jgi:hypothetical protein
MFDSAAPAYAYFIPGASTGLTADPLAAGPAQRLRKSGPWAEREGNANGKSGVIVTHPNCGPIPDTVPWTECEDGLLFRCAVPPDLAHVGRESAPDNVDVKLICGKTVSIALALEAPRQFMMSKRMLGGPVGDFSKIVEEVSLVKEGEQYPTDLVIRFITAALAECYRITPEILDAMGIISDKDILPLWEAAMALGPK